MNQENICNNTVTKDPTTPQVCQNLVSWLSEKAIKLLPPDITFKAKMHPIRFLASVRLSLRWSLTRTEHAQ